MHIDTLSWQPDAKPVHWECDGGTEFDMTEGGWDQVGTCITLFLNEDCLQFCNGVDVGVGVGAGNVRMIRQRADVYFSLSLTRTTAVGQLTPILECRGEIHFRQRGHV